MGESMGGGGWASAVPMALKAGSSLLGAIGNSRADSANRDAIDAIERQGQSIKAAREWGAKQLETEGQARFAAGQRTALAEKRKGKLVLSNLQAKAAASGGGSDPTVMKLGGQIGAEASYRLALALAAAQEAKRGYNTAAGGKRYEGALAEHGANARASGMRKAMGTTALGRVASALGNLAGESLWQKFGEPDYGLSGNNWASPDSYDGPMNWQGR